MVSFFLLNFERERERGEREEREREWGSEILCLGMNHNIC